MARPAPAAEDHAAARPGLAAYAAYAALAGTLLVTALAAWQVTAGWARQRAAVRRAVQLHAVNAARVVVDEMRRTSTELRVRLLVPLLGKRDGPPVTLDAFERHVVAFLGVPLTEGDPLRGLFAVGAADGGAAQLRGGLARDPVYARAVLAAVAARRLQPGTNPDLPVGTYARYRGAPITVVFALRHAGGAASARGRDAGAAEVMGMAFARAPALKRELEDALAHVPLLGTELDAVAVPPLPPPAPRRAGDVAPGPSAYAPAAPGARPPPTGNDRVAVRWWTAGAGRPYELLYETPGTPASWWAGQAAAVGAARYAVNGDSVEVAVRPALTAALEAAAVPASQRVLLGGVLALGVGFALATLGELRRQRELGRARAYFVAAVSHELRTPLAQIRMFSELLGTGRTRSPEQAERWLGVINREAVRLGGLVENVLLFTRGEADGFRVAPRAEDAAELARDAAAAFAPLAAGRGATVRVEAPPRAPVWADADAVRQLLGNLLDNAVKYGPEGQTVTLRVEHRPGYPGAASRRVRGGVAGGNGAVGPRPFAGGAVALLVDDQGPGVAPADRARVWRPFERLRADHGTTGGSGLGLGLVRELAERQGGRAWVEGAPGGGARFGVLLPARDPGGGAGA